MRCVYLEEKYSIDVLKEVKITSTYTDKTIHYCTMWADVRHDLLEKVVSLVQPLIACFKIKCTIKCAAFSALAAADFSKRTEDQWSCIAHLSAQDMLN